MKDRGWENHYHREKSGLAYPDENLVRLIKKNIDSARAENMTAIDLGCGSGRHIRLLKQMGLHTVLGMDSSRKALTIARDLTSAYYVQNDNRKIPVKDKSADIIVAWGSLHYNHKDHFPVMISEIQRVLKDGGHFFATLRSSFDTYMKQGKHLGDDVWITDLEDIEGSMASFYNEDELKGHLKKFSRSNYGIIERTVIGDLNKRLSHWVIEAIQ